MKTVHALWQGLALCGFMGKIPMYWPNDHFWVSPDDLKNINCPECKKLAEARRKRK